MVTQPGAGSSEPTSGISTLDAAAVGAPGELVARKIQGRSLGQIAFLATALSVVIGTVAGVVSGYFGGWVDTLISRTMDVFLAFPLLLFAIALAGVVPDHAFGLGGDTLRITLLIFIIGFFNWPYI